MKKLLEKLLGWIAQRIVERYEPTIVAVTGSVGKTSTKDAIALVLARRFRVRASPKNYNNELGVPLTIMDVQAPGRSVVRWFGLLTWGLVELLTRDPKFPEVLVLEMGADRPGDLEKLVRIAPPRVSVVTAVAAAHTEFFKDLKDLQKEKGTVIRALPPDGVAVISRDNDLAYELRETTKASVQTFGFRDGSDFQAAEMKVSGDPLGVAFKLEHAGASIPVHIPGVLGRPSVQAALAAAAVGTALGCNLHEVSDALLAFSPPPGRLRLVAGIKNTTLIDDTYNASPLAALEALEALRSLAEVWSGRTIAIFGDMKELGSFAYDSHHEVGARAGNIGVDLLVVVGIHAADYAAGARAAGLSDDHIRTAPDAVSAGRLVQDYIREGDIILIKGSQSMRMERAVRELMAEPLRAAELLVRQEPEWQA